MGICGSSNTTVCEKEGIDRKSSKKKNKKIEKVKDDDVQYASSIGSACSSIDEDSDSDSDEEGRLELVELKRKQSYSSKKLGEHAYIEEKVKQNDAAEDRRINKGSFVGEHSYIVQTEKKEKEEEEKRLRILKREEENKKDSLQYVEHGFVLEGDKKEAKIEGE